MLVIEAEKSKKDKDILEITERQFIGNYPSDVDKKRFNKWIRTAPTSSNDSKSLASVGEKQ